MGATLPADFDPDIVDGIRARLNAAREDATILFAIESGSRAWGFPSPDSDYDCRFVYVRSVKDHLRLEPMRDVIEFPIEGDLDVGGWDLKKALLLALGGNAVIGEWVDSVICYEEVPNFRTEMAALLETIVEPHRVAHHYLGLARSGLSRHDPDAGEIKLKKLFYILRPLIALQWMEQNGFERLPPMNFNTGLSDIEIDHELRQTIDTLLAQKAKTRELGTGNAPEPILDFIRTRFEHFEQTLPSSTHIGKPKKERVEVAEKFYRDIVLRFDAAHP